MLTPHIHDQQPFPALRHRSRRQNGLLYTRGATYQFKLHEKGWIRNGRCACGGSVAPSIRCDSCDAFPVVYAQQTKRNQAMCSLMSAVLLRKANEQYSQQLRCCRNKTRRLRETIQQSSKRRAEDASLTWRFPGNEEASDASYWTH